MPACLPFGEKIYFSPDFYLSTLLTIIQYSKLSKSCSSTERIVPSISFSAFKQTVIIENNLIFSLSDIRKSSNTTFFYHFSTPHISIIFLYALSSLYKPVLYLINILPIPVIVKLDVSKTLYFCCYISSCFDRGVG